MCRLSLFQFIFLERFEDFMFLPAWKSSFRVQLWAWKRRTRKKYATKKKKKRLCRAFSLFFFSSKPRPVSLPVWIASATSFFRCSFALFGCPWTEMADAFIDFRIVPREESTYHLSGEAANISGGKHTSPERKIIPISSQRPISPYILFWYAIMGKMSSTVILVHSYTKITIGELTGWMTEIKTRQQIINSQQTEISQSISEFWMFTCLFFIISFGSRWVLETLNEIFPF